MSLTAFEAFCAEFGVDAADLGHVVSIGRRHYLINDEKQEELLLKLKQSVFAAGVFLGEEKRRFEPSAALLELISSRTKEHKAVVDEKAAWLFLCDRDILTKGVVKLAEPTESGYLLVQDQRDENLGFGLANQRKNVAVKNILDRGNFLRRERFE